MASASFGTEVIVDLEISVFISMMKYLNVTLDRIVENSNAHTIILMLERTIFRMEDDTAKERIPVSRRRIPTSTSQLIQKILKRKE